MLTSEGEAIMDIPSDDELLGHVVRYLIEGDELDAANVLLTCSLHLVEFIEDPEPSQWNMRKVEIKGPRKAYEILNNSNHEITRSRNPLLLQFMHVTQTL
jgi:hypothetical protein